MNASDEGIAYYEYHLTVAQEMGDRVQEGIAYGNLGSAFRNHGDFKKSLVYHKYHLTIAQELGDRAQEGFAYGNLGTAFYGLGDFKDAKDNLSLCLTIAKEVVINHLKDTHIAILAVFAAVLVISKSALITTI